VAPNAATAFAPALAGRPEVKRSKADLLVMGGEK
jgi:hypothetical protein